MQRLLKESLIRWELNHLTIFDCKTYVLLKDANVSPRTEKMKARAFVDYLIDYDSINIFKVWNFEKDDVNDYRDVIFDEITYYDIYDKDKRHLIKKSERKNFVQFRIYLLVEMVWVEPTPTHSNPRWCGLYCGFSKVQPNPFFLDYCDYFVDSHQTHAKKDTCCTYSFTREKRYIE